MLTSLLDLRDTLSLTRGWTERDWQGQRVLAAEFGGNEMRFRVANTKRLALHIVTEPYVFCHVLADGRHIAKIRPEANPAIIDIPVSPAGTEVTFLRTAVSSGPFYVDAMVIAADTDEGATFLSPTTPVPEKVFATFGDSISGNCCIGDDAPFDPYGLGYGYQICERFGWQYFNCARDGSGVCCTPFDNPLAIDRVEKDLLRHNPDFLLVYYGTNDVRNIVTADQFREGYSNLLERIIAGLPNARIATSGLLWTGIVTNEKIESFNDVIRDLSAQLHLPYCHPKPLFTIDDFCDDVHPGVGGQKKLARVFGDFLAAHWPECQQSPKAAHS
jgi:lysophospholipase L1-like esterase